MPKQVSKTKELKTVKQTKKSIKNTKTENKKTKSDGVENTPIAEKKSHKMLAVINKNIKQIAHKSWDSTKKYSVVVKDKTVSVSKFIYHASVKLGLAFSEKAQCEKCKTVNEPIGYVWEDLENGFNNIERPAPDFAKKLNKYKCQNCNEEYTRKMRKKEPVCPSCGSLDCAMETDGDTDYVDTKYAKYAEKKVYVSWFKSYVWGTRTIDLHQIYKCPKCDIKCWQHKSVSQKDCCPYCHSVGVVSTRTYVEDVSTYSKSEVIAHRSVRVDSNTYRSEPVYGQVAYEHGYEITEYYCPECGEIVYRKSGWYDRRL